MTNNPAVSIIVPVYNTQEHLDQCISSISKQQFKDFELIIVDDGSTDSSAAICDQWAARDSRIHVIHQANSGVSPARNAGLDAAHGIFVCFVDSDDWLDPNTLNITVGQADRRNADLVAFGYYSHFSPDETRNRHPESHHLATPVYFHNVNGDAAEYDNNVAQLEDELYLFQCWGKLFRRSWIGRQRFNTKISYGEDTAFVFQLLGQQNTVVYALADTLYHYREQNTGLAGRFSLSKPYDIEWQHHVRLDFYHIDHLTDAHRDTLTARLTSDVLWALLAIKQAPQQINFAQKMEYIHRLANSPLRGLYLQGLRHAWATRGIKILYQLNSTILWHIYAYLH